MASGEGGASGSSKRLVRYSPFAIRRLSARTENVMTWLPGWNSIEGSARWGDIFFWTGFALLLVLAGCIVLSKLYGWRRDALIVRRDQLIAIAQDLRGHTDSIEPKDQARVAVPVPQRAEPEPPGARIPAEPTDKAAAEPAAPERMPDRVARLQERPPRGLTEGQKKSMIAALAPFRGQKFSIVCIVDDREGKNFGGEIIAVLRAAGWDFPESAVGEATYGKEPIGISVLVNTAQIMTPSVLRPTSILVKSLADAGLMPRDGALADPTIPRDRIEIRIGRNRNPS
jgi:hypothetical protein